jgi:competence protein ComEC
LALVLGPLELPILPPPVAVGLALFGVLCAVTPILRARWIVCVILLGTLMLDRRTPLPLNHFRLTVLDVGQGLAVVVETASKMLVYDTGPRFGRYSAGADIVAPFLRQRGIATIDRLVLSHGDTDHAGSWLGLAESIEVLDIWISPVHKFAAPHSVCERGRT